MKSEKVAEKQTLQVVKDLLHVTKEFGALNDKLIVEVERLTKRELEAADIISSLLVELNKVEEKAIILELQPKAQRFLSASKAAHVRKAAAKAKTEANVWDALVKEVKNNTPKNALVKRIAIDLKLTPQYVGRIIKRWSIEPKRC